MIVRCDVCLRSYDDTYRLTYCPHITFPMRTVILKDGIEVIATDLDQLDALLK